MSGVGRVRPDVGAAAHPTEERVPRRWRDVLSEVTGILGSATDARRIVEEASGLSGASLVLAMDDAVPARVGARVSQIVERRAAGEPLQYSLGRWSFRTLDLLVDRRVLIPRPETEVVAGLAIAEAGRLATLAGQGEVTVADMGTGSGAIALSVAAEVPTARVWATDIADDALCVARANLCGLAGRAATRVQLALGSWFDALPAELRGRLDLVVSNPPYVADDEVLAPQVQEWEPPIALRAGPTGLECLALLIEQAPGWLSPAGALVVEVAPHQASQVEAMAGAVGFADVAIHLDLAGRRRVLVGRRRVLAARR